MKSFAKSITVYISCSIAAVFLLAACGGTGPKAMPGTSKDDAAAAPAQAARAAQATAAAAAASAEADINKNASGKTMIRAISKSATYPCNSYMLISKSGTVVVCDPFETADGVRADVITSTHRHPDHRDLYLFQHSKCKQSLNTVESFTVKDVNIHGIASSHKGNDIDKANPTNVIYVYELDGLRIAHMGDIGQDTLTDEQMQELGKVDIAFMQFVNPYSDYSLENGKGFKLIEQLKPQIIIPTHTSEEADKKICDIVGAHESVINEVPVSKDDLMDGKRKVIQITDTLASEK